MKRLIVAAGMLAVCLGAWGAEEKGKSPLMASDTVIWAGLDYSMVRMIGSGEFNDPSAIFPGMLQAWNDLFVRERFKFVEKETKKHFVPDLGGVTERNRTATPKQIIATAGPEDVIDKSHIAEQDIANAVKAYKLESKSGLGLVFIVDRLVKPKGALYVVFFDVATRQVVSCERQVQQTAGFGFRNYWFGFIKKAEATLKKIR